MRKLKKSMKDKKQARPMAELLEYARIIQVFFVTFYDLMVLKKHVQLAIA